MAFQRITNIFRRKDPSSKPVPRRRLQDSAEAIQIDGVSEEPAYSARRQQFRRNQTLTGSTSSNVSSAAETSGTIQSPRAATHHLRRKQRSLGVRIVTLLILAGATMFFLYEFIAVAKVSYYGQVTDSSDSGEVASYQQSIQAYLSQRPLERIRPFLREDNLATYLQNTGSPEVREVAAVSAAGLGEAQFVIKMREPVVTWTIDGNKQYVDKDGYIFRKNHYSEPSVTVIDESGISTGSDITTIASSRFLQFIGLGVGFAKSEGLAINRVIIPADTTRQVQFAINDDKRTRIKLSVDRLVGEQVEDAVRAYQFLRRQGTDARYIDVRVSGRAFYI